MKCIQLDALSCLKPKIAITLGILLHAAPRSLKPKNTIQKQMDVFTVQRPVTLSDRSTFGHIPIP